MEFFTGVIILIGLFLYSEYRGAATVDNEKQEENETK